MAVLLLHTCLSRKRSLTPKQQERIRTVEVDSEALLKLEQKRKLAEKKRRQEEEEAAPDEFVDLEEDEVEMETHGEDADFGLNGVEAD